jgi:diguanylate cyclase (GGDEF)-like protein
MNFGKAINLLIVDDDEDDLYLIMDALNEVHGTRYSVTTAASPLAAMAQLSKTTFDVIFSDYRLGPVTGVQFIKSVRNAGIDTPIILLTGIADHVIDAAALKAGSSDFVPKTSITSDVLDRSVRYALAHAERQRLLQTVLKNTMAGIAVLDRDRQLSLWNPQFLAFAQQAFGEDLNRFEKLLELTCQSGEKDIAVGDRIVEAHVTPLPDGGSVVALHDVTQRVSDLRDRELAEERIRKVAMQDVLTGLPNRMAFNEYLDCCLDNASVGSRSVAVLLFDFNRFKEVNDIFGHAAGDQILKSAAVRLREALSEQEYVARLGGDEFVLVQNDSNPERAFELAQRVVACLSAPVEWEVKLIEASVSVGVALYPNQGQNRQQLLANADLAMYRGKAEVGRPICIFDANMDLFIRNRRKLAHDLRHAIQNDELSLALQPQFYAGTGELVGFEALLRWSNPLRGMVSPNDFIPIAEETGLIVEIDEWVLRRACKLLTNCPWINRLAVNISAKAICQPSIDNMVRSVLMETQVSPLRLELEVTETAFVYDLNRALHNLRQIKALGISVAMDDFGTGYSSLSLLNSFPFDRIKIDGSFIQLTGNNARADSIFRAVVGLGSALNVPVLAEGVETNTHLEFATSSGCEEVQGFHVGQPIAEISLVSMYKALGCTMHFSDVRNWQVINALSVGVSTVNGLRSELRSA